MPEKKPNILLIAIDSLVSTHMSCYGYRHQTTPHIDRFAEDGALFEQTFSPNVPTTPAYTCMLTGRDIFATQCVALRHRGGLTDQVTTLPELLGEEGYSTVCVGFSGNPGSRGFQEYLDYKAWGDRSDGALRKAEGLNAVTLPKLQELSDQDAPFFMLLRHMDPHSPYLPPAPFDRLFYQGNECDPANDSMEPVMAFKPFCDYFKSWMPPDLTDKDYVIAQYDGAVAYMDACIQQIFEKLDQLGILDDTIVVLNSDHGETLYDHECWFDHHGIYDNTLKVPLIIRYPEGVPAGIRVAGFNQHMDLVPTLLELAGIDSDIPFEGTSLMRLVEGTAPTFAPGFYISECTWMRKHGWRTPEWKLIHALEPDFHFKPEVELYNLLEDPDENNNVADQHPDIVTMLEGQMAAHIAMREAQTGIPNPMYNQPGWHGHGETVSFTSSQEAYDTLHIGNPTAARKLQAESRK